MTQQDDITQRLRDNADLDEAEHGNARVVQLERDAADEIERLRAELSQVRAPVAEQAALFAQSTTKDDKAALGMLECGKPLCAPGEHHPLCRNGWAEKKGASAPTPKPWPVEEQPDGTVTPVDPVDLASAPVAGEAQNSNSLYAAKSSTCDAARIIKLPAVDTALAAFVENSDGNTALALVRVILDAAPQASAEDVRNAALEQAAQAAYNALFPTNDRSDWTELAESAAYHAKYACQCIRALKQPQADKDGGQQRAGDDLINALGQCRDAFPIPDMVGSQLDLLWQEAMSDPTAVPAYVKACVARAALSAPQAEQGERDA